MMGYLATHQSFSPTIVPWPSAPSSPASRFPISPGRFAEGDAGGVDARMSKLREAMNF
jgi:hypothetical protein